MKKHIFVSETIFCPDYAMDTATSNWYVEHTSQKLSSGTNGVIVVAEPIPD